MNVLLLSSRFVHAAASSILQRRLWSEGIDVWLDWPMDHDSYSEQMLSMMDKSTFIVLLVNKEFFADSVHRTEWEAARVSRTPKLVLLLDDHPCPSVNETLTVCPKCSVGLLLPRSMIDVMENMLFIL